MVSLYGDDEGYSIMLPQLREVGEQREVALPYEDMELLSYIEANEVSQSRLSRDVLGVCKHTCICMCVGACVGACMCGCVWVCVGVCVNMWGGCEMGGWMSVGGV